MDRRSAYRIEKIERSPTADGRSELRVSMTYLGSADDPKVKAMKADSGTIPTTPPPGYSRFVAEDELITFIPPGVSIAEGLGETEEEFVEEEIEEAGVSALDGRPRKGRKK